MKTMKTTIVSLTLLALWATTAFATPTTGLVLNPADLSNTTQVELMKQIKLDRARVPAAHQSVRRIILDADRLNDMKRGRMAPFTMMFKRLGPDALMPMLEALAFDVPSVDGYAPQTKIALRAGLVEAVGMLRDARAVPVLRAILTSGVSEHHLVRSTVEAMA